MRNLRLTEAAVDNNSQSTAFGLLAQEMHGGLVSNMTLEGEVNITCAGEAQDVGGLIGQISAGEINTITSMVKITYTHTSAASSMGGIVGYIAEPLEDANVNDKTVKLYYNSNYGPITGQQKARAVGGIVGSFASNRESKVTIDHCFNGSSVLAGYSGTNANDVEYHAGGILSFIEGENSYAEITNCYNAGIIKAGNKSHTDMAYAAGIVAHSKTSGVTDSNHTTDVYIGNCYNEGSIEALGTDPETAIQYATDSAGNNIVQVISKTDINVSAYYIADIEVDNCGSIEADTLQEGDEPYYLQRNGSTTDSDEVIYQVDYKSKLLDYFGTSEKNREDEPIPSEDHGIFNPDDVRDTFWGYDGPYDRYDILWDKGFIIYYSDRGFGGSNAKIQFQYDNKQDSWYNLQYGVNNIPIVFADYQSYTVKAYLLAFNSYSNPSSSQGERLGGVHLKQTNCGI